MGEGAGGPRDQTRLEREGLSVISPRLHVTGQRDSSSQEKAPLQRSGKMITAKFFRSGDRSKGRVASLTWEQWKGFPSGAIISFGGDL